MMPLPSGPIPDPLIVDARKEVERCRSALADGSPRDFWQWRLGDYLRRLEEAATIIRAQLADVESAQPGDTHG